MKLSGIRITRLSDTILIPLPPELWRMAGDGRCSCPHCGEDKVAYWDALAVSIARDTTWTVHAPELQS